ncbi:MAG: FMN-binding protein, partial [Prevotella sp.]|nr:FMN-binding protein [Prevotella sp.]
DKWFQKGQKGDIIGKNPKDKDLTVKKDGGEIDAITASTITSRAFLKAINQAYHAYIDKGVDAHSGATKQADKVAKR